MLRPTRSLIQLINNPPRVSKIKAGWPVGAGAEWMFARNRSAKVEYFYLYLGNVSAIGRSASL